MLRKIISIVSLVSLIFQQVGLGQAAGGGLELNLAGYFSRMPANYMPDTYRPVHLRFFSYSPLEDNFQVMLDKGDLKDLSKGELTGIKDELMNYFLIGVSLPNDSFWVNLRPDSADSIIDVELAQTDIGKIMLEADLELKKDTANFTSPQTQEGKEYWMRLYKKAEELYGRSQVSIPTLTRPWIVPAEIIVRQTEESAYIYKATLKVMLEQDHLTSPRLRLNESEASPQISYGRLVEAKPQRIASLGSDYAFKDPRAKALNDYSAQLMRELILPKLTKEVNLSKKYASFRQVYYSLIFSRWFKMRFRGQDTSYASRIDRHDLTGLISKTNWSKETYFNAYQKSFASGEYNIQEPVMTPTGQVIRTYFSGGIAMGGSEVAAAMQGILLPEVGSSPALMEETLGRAGLVNPDQEQLGSTDGEIFTGATVKHGSFPVKVGAMTSEYGPHHSQKGLRPLFERVAWARSDPWGLRIKDIYAFEDQKHGMEPKEALSFGMVLEAGDVIIQNAPVMGGISAGEAEPGTHPSIKEAIGFFNKNVRRRLIGLSIGSPDIIGQRIMALDEWFRAKAEDKEKPRFSYIGSEISTGISMISTIALAEMLHVPVEVVINYRYNEYCMTHGLADAVRPMSIPVNYSVVWEGGKHGVAKTLKELMDEGIIKDGSRFPHRFHDPELSKDKDNQLAMVPPQETQIMSFAPSWTQARHDGIDLTKAYQKTLKAHGIKTKYGAESGFTTDQMRDKNGRLITLELVLDNLAESLASLPLAKKKYIRAALDFASSEMYIPEIDMYYIGPEAAGNADGLVTNSEFTAYKLKLLKNYPFIISVEDWADESKIEHWEDAKLIMPTHIQMGDDNIVSRGDLIRKFARVINAGLQKPNQSGLDQVEDEAVGASHQLGNVVVWSHRGTRSPQEVYTAQAAIGTGSFGGKWTLWGPGRSALIAVMTQADTLFNSGLYPGVEVPYQGALVLDPNGPYRDVGWAKKLRQEIATASDQPAASSPVTAPIETIRAVEARKAVKERITADLNAIFDQRFKDNDATAVDEIIEYHGKLSSVDERQAFYEWLQFHESKLTADVIARIGLNWLGVVDKLEAKIFGLIEGNARASLRQLHELATVGTYAGVRPPENIADQITTKAKQVWQAHQEFEGLLAYGQTPEFPTLRAKNPGVLVLVRHGETVRTEAVLNKWAGWADAPITENGRRQAFLAGQRLGDVLHFNRAYSSDLSRAKDTLAQILRATEQPDVPVEIRQQIRERDYGDMIGWRRSLVQQVFGESTYLGWRRGYAGDAERPAGGENLKDVQERSLPVFLQEIMVDIANGLDVVVSAHGNSLRSMLIALRGHTNGQALTEDEIRKLEVELSTPIVITFDNTLHHKELWVNAEKGPVDVVNFVGNRSAASSPLADLADKRGLGGIDFRNKAMQITYEPIGDFSKLNVVLPSLSLAELEKFDIDAEIAELEGMVEHQLLPSGNRIKEVLAACNQKSDSWQKEHQRLMALLVKVGLLEEKLGYGQDCSREYKEAIVIVDTLLT